MASSSQSSQAVIDSELAQVRASKVFSVAQLRHEVLCELLLSLNNSFSDRANSISWPERFGDENDLCNFCTQIPLTRHSRRISSTTVRTSIALDRVVSLGSLAVVQSRTYCALCRVVSGLVLKDRSLGVSKGSASKNCILRPAVGSFRTYNDHGPLCDVFYGDHSTNRLRGHIRWNYFGDIPIDVWKYASKHHTISPLQQAWAQFASSIVDHENTRSYHIDFEQIRGWLKVCEDGHSSTCSPGSATSRYQNVVDLVLIDTKEARLVKASSAYRYITLSYVWGRVGMCETTVANFVARQQKNALKAAFRHLPGVIQDAWKVVEGLKERYLWIDALCIVQDDENDLMKQIPQMDKVYNQSFLTIIALSGEDAASKLPGVSEPRSPIQPTERTASWLFTGESPTLDWALGAARYETRAWTFQERILSNRRLFLTDWQVYFQCYRFVYQETFSNPRQILQDPNSLQIVNGDSAYLNISYGRLSAYTLWHIRNLKLSDRTTLIQWGHSSLMMYDQLVTELSVRGLMRKDDILRAFAGLVSYMESHQSGPFAAGVPLKIIDRALLWAPAGKVVRRQVTPNLSLPSWSWCAWEGPVRHIWAKYGVLNELMRYDYRAIGSDIKDFFLEKDGSLSRIDRMAFDLDNPSRPLPAGHPDQHRASRLGGSHLLLHFQAHTAQATSFSTTGGQIPFSEAFGNWTLALAVGRNLAVTELRSELEGAFIQCSSLGKNIINLTSSVFRNSSEEESVEQNANDSPPATWIYDSKGEKCGILLDYEQESSQYFASDECQFVLLSRSNSVPEWRYGTPFMAEARGERFMLYQQPAPMDDYSLLNVLLVEWKNGYATRVGIGQMLGTAFEAACPQSRYIILG